jgi:predicted ATP-grasp superfamily ATP-dependent carboligase
VTAAAVVVGLDCITGLQTARILAARGVQVVGVAADPRHFACRSRAVSRLVIAPAAGQPLLAALGALVHDEPPVLFPCTDAAVATLSAGRDQLAGRYRLLLASHEVVERLMDKRAFGSYATAHGLPVPRTIALLSRTDAERAADELEFPVALKPALKTPRWQRHTTAKAFEVADPSALLDLYDRCAGWADELIAQEWVVGGADCLYSCNAYFDADARPLAAFVSRKLRQWPPSTGTSCLGEEARNDEVLAETLRLFQGAGFHGLAYLEMKRDARTGRHLIIEPNVGRPTGRSAIAEAGGVELLMTAYCDGAGLPLPAEAARTQTYGGAKWIYLRHDAQAAWYHWRRGALPARAYLRSISGRKIDAVWAPDDPLPFVFDLWRAARKRLARQRRDAGARTADSQARDAATRSTT